MIYFGILEMDMTFEAPFFAFLTIYINCVTGLALPTPENLRVDILDGEATAYWSRPTNAPADIRYNVEMAKYTDSWKKVEYCTGITNTNCDLSSLIQDYMMGYKVKVQLVVGTNASAWITKKFVPNTSKLRPPRFTLRPAYNSLTVFVHQKPIWLKLFPSGFIYTIYLEQTGEDKKVIISKNVAALPKWEDQNTATFRPLDQRSEYCVSISMQSQASPSISPVSHKQCVLLPEEEWYIVAVTCLSFLAVLAFASIIIVILFFHLRRPEKTPAVLKLPVSDWRPLSVAEGTMEVVTDKGWFLSSYRSEEKNESPAFSVTPKEHKVEGRWTSMDSGVSMEPNSANVSRGNSPERHEDSGCGSLSGSEGSTSNQTEYPLSDDKAGTGMDSRVGLDCQLRSSAGSLDEQDSVSPKTTVVVGNYRSQSPSAALEPIVRHSVLAEVVSGYRAAAQVCICSGAGQCTWCHKQALSGKGVVGQHRATCTENGLRSISKQDSVDSRKAAAFLSYFQKSLEDTFTVEDSKSTFIHLEETFPMLTALAPQDNNMNCTLSLCDVQMAAD